MTGFRAESAHAKIARAREHRATLHGEIRAWFDSKPYRLTKKVNEERTRWSIEASVSPLPDVMRWGLIFGDAIHNLRTALDHLFFALCERHADGASIDPGDLRRRTFPLDETSHGFASFRGARKAFLPPEMWTAIEGEQLYNRPEKFRGALLMLLRDLDISDKHHALSLMVLAQSEIGWTGAHVPGGSAFDMILDTHFMLGIQGPDDRAEVSILNVPKQPPEVDPQFHMTTFVAIKEGPATPVENVLDILAEEVGGIVERVSSAVT